MKKFSRSLQQAKAGLTGCDKKMEDMEEYLPEIQQEKKIEIPTELYKQITGKKVFKGTPNILGDGSLLALKLSQQIFDKSVYVFSENNILAGFVPSLITKNPAATATGMARFSKGLKDNKIVCFADSQTTKATLPSIIAAAERDENITYICNNAEWLPKKPSFARLIKCHYAATASVGFPEDYILKLRKCHAKNGFRFIDVLAPRPETWGFDQSNTVSIAKLASQSKLWPLYEAEDGFAKITKRPDVESVERYVNSHERTKIFSPEEINALQKAADRFSKQLSEGFLF